MKKTVGILGGMGPLATADLFRKIITHTRAETDQEHIPVLIDSNTAIPDRTAALLYGGADPMPEMIRSAKRLEAAGADVLVMPCNTAHGYLDRLARQVRIPFLNMIDLTCRASASRPAALRRRGTASTRPFSMPSTAAARRGGSRSSAFPPSWGALVRCSS